MPNERLFTILTRVGFLARGLLYIAIGILVVGLGRAEGPDGALSFLADGLGRSTLYVIAAGFAAYGLWRLADAAFGTEHPGDGKRALAKRAGAGASGVVHLLLAYQTFKLAAGAAARSSGSSDQQAQTVLELPFGGLLLAAVGIGLGIAGLVQLKKAASCDFLRNLLPQAQENAVKWLGRLGYAARGIVFLVIAYFVVTAALGGDASKAGGMEQVFAELSRPVSLGLAAGLFLFGVYGLVEAWYRRINAPNIGGLACQARARI